MITALPSLTPQSPRLPLEPSLPQSPGKARRNQILYVGPRRRSARRTRSTVTNNIPSLSDPTKCKRAPGDSEEDDGIKKLPSIIIRGRDHITVYEGESDLASPLALDRKQSGTGCKWLLELASLEKNLANRDSDQADAEDRQRRTTQMIVNMMLTSKGDLPSATQGNTQESRWDILRRRTRSN
jgi:hypothetical protein